MIYYEIALDIPDHLDLVVYIGLSVLLNTICCCNQIVTN